MVGLQSLNDGFLQKIIENKSRVYEVYFSWGDFPSGRSDDAFRDGLIEWEMQEWQVSAIKKLSEEGISLNLLLNANCYGSDSQSRAFFEKIGSHLDYIGTNYSLKSVTTTSPLIAKFIKNNFEGIEVRASVNMEIGTVEAMEYLSPYFDSYYMKRELNRDFAVIKKLNLWCGKEGKKLFMLANSGCLNNCPARNFHDNLVSHEAEIAKMDNAYNFIGLCREFLSDEQNYSKLIEYTNFVRPEDMEKYGEYFSAAKLATRVHKYPEAVLESYINGRYSGDMLRLLEPSYSIYPYVIENGRPLKLKKINTDLYMGGTDNDIKQAH